MKHVTINLTKDGKDLKLQRIAEIKRLSTVLLKKWCWTIGHPCAERMNIYQNSEWITKPKTNTLKKNQEKIFLTSLSGLGKDFLNTTPKAQSIKEYVDELDFIKLKLLGSLKDWKNNYFVNRIKRNKLGEKFAKHLSDKGLVSRL